MTIGQALRKTKDLLAQKESGSVSSVDSEAEQLIIFHLKRGKFLNSKDQLSSPKVRLEFLGRLNEELPESILDEIIESIRLRYSNVPLQHITGVQFFNDHEYLVNPDVLIPRPETEILLRAAIDAFGGGFAPEMGLEVGLGSGNLSIELLAHFKNLEMLATEISSSAIETAKINLKKILGPDEQRRLSVLQPKRPDSVLTPAIESLAGKKVGFLISNPPYVDGPHETEREVFEHEPHAALFSPPGDPLFFYREMIHGAQKVLKPGGYVFFEIPHERADAISKLVKDEGIFEFKVLKDLTGRQRVIVAKLKEG